jgi:hypothetical protein
MRATNVPDNIMALLENTAPSKHKMPKKASHRYNSRSHAKNSNEAEAKASSKQAPSKKAPHLYGLRQRHVSSIKITAAQNNTTIKKGEEESSESTPLLPTCF